MRKGDFDIYMKDVTSSAPATPVVDSPYDDAPLLWISDRVLAIDQSGDDGRYRVKLLDLDKPDRLTTISDYNPDGRPSMSADRAWLAPADAHSGRDEVYVQRATGNGAVEQVSVTGGASPAFSRTARELYYQRGQDIVVATWREDR